jgi:hypothetical protein
LTGGEARRSTAAICDPPAFAGAGYERRCQILLVEPSHQRQLFSIRRHRPAADPAGRQSEQHIGRTDRSSRPRAIIALPSAGFIARTSGRKILLSVQSLVTSASRLGSLPVPLARIADA